MRVPLLVAFFFGVAAAPAAYAMIHASQPRDLLNDAACESNGVGPKGARDCATSAEDDAELAAKLLVARFGDDAPAYADRLAKRYEAEHDATSAHFWHRISQRAATLTQ